MSEETKLNSFQNRLDQMLDLTEKKQKNVDDCLSIWFVQKRREGILVSRTTLQLQIEKLLL